jgi:hypothetical protein
MQGVNLTFVGVHHLDMLVLVPLRARRGAIQVESGVGV